MLFFSNRAYNGKRSSIGDNKVNLAYAFKKALAQRDPDLVKCFEKKLHQFDGIPGP